jgi:hypothetical protein
MATQLGFHFPIKISRYKPVFGGSSDRRQLKKKLREQGLRKEVLDALGNKCARCGYHDPRALCIDHIHGAGRLERSQRKCGTRAYYRDIVLKNLKMFQLLCANCNMIKAREEGAMDRSGPAYSYLNPSKDINREWNNLFTENQGNHYLEVKTNSGKIIVDFGGKIGL